jgi:uncharacterized alkaline shock family protein YloU
MTELARTDLGGIAIAPAALSRLVVRAVEEVDGARVRHPRRSLHVQLADGRARVSLELQARRGSVLPELARAVQRRVADALGAMLEVAVDGVDVSVEEVD